MSRPFLLLDLGFTDYQKAWSLQHRLVEARAKGSISDVLILVEHPHVLTMGRKANAENVFSRPLPVYQIERGGDVTYHGPGQLVGYPIIKLDEGRIDIHQYLRDLEEALIMTLRDFEINAERSSMQTGVWVRDKKIASIGIAVQRWISFHGFALNVNTDLSYFGLIRPCGLDSSIMTSMKETLGCEVNLGEVKEALKNCFEVVFKVSLSSRTEKELTMLPSLTS
ncbi:MAG: lipoyl(octanoyl) transferase LipB [Thaumarchaeota archaeon]|nr:lipoyl(octanoyl) transferase LipB [Nitrososphaerota archaeon]